MLGVLARLHLLTGEARYRARAEQLLAAFSGEASRNPAVHAALLAGTLWLEQPIQVVVIGAPGEPGCEALRRIALAAPRAAATLLTVAPEQALPAGHPAAGKTRIGDRRDRLCLPRSDLRPADHRAGRARGRARAGQPSTGGLTPTRRPRGLSAWRSAPPEVACPPQSGSEGRGRA